MIKCYFGLPGCGKTTILTAIAQRERKKKDTTISTQIFIVRTVLN